MVGESQKKKTFQYFLVLGSNSCDSSIIELFSNTLCLVGKLLELYHSHSALS